MSREALEHAQAPQAQPGDQPADSATHKKARGPVWLQVVCLLAAIGGFRAAFKYEFNVALFVVATAALILTIVLMSQSRTDR